MHVTHCNCHPRQSCLLLIAHPHVHQVSIWDAFCGMFKGYEQAVFVPLWGLRDVNEYHERASVHTSVANITRPLLVVHARDDPVVPVASLPLKEVICQGNSLPLLHIRSSRLFLRATNVVIALCTWYAKHSLGHNH